MESDSFQWYLLERGNRHKPKYRKLFTCRKKNPFFFFLVIFSFIFK